MKGIKKIKLFLIFFFPVSPGVCLYAQLPGSPNIFRKAHILPDNIVLTAGQKYFISSIYDADYLPYTVPAGPATTNVVNASGTADPLINVQGTLTTTGVTIQIPYTVVVSSVTLPAFSQIRTVPASLTEDGISRDVELSYSGGTYGVGSGTITATIKSLGGTLNVKKLDINAGMGNDYLGVLLVEFTLPHSSVGYTGNVQLRGMSGIPDRMFGVADNLGDITSHRFIYLPVIGRDGKVWLNNNLGAAYARISYPQFNPARQAVSSADNDAHGSIFQWGRRPDGHELQSWAPTTIRSDNPENVLFIVTESEPFDWRINWNNHLWSSEASTNNPCPRGFRVPTWVELDAQRLSWSNNNASGALGSPLRLSMPGYRANNGSGPYVDTGSRGTYWSRDASSNFFSWALDFNSSNASIGAGAKSMGYAVRCIKD